MGDLSAEPSMEDILSSIKRIISEEGEAAPKPRRATSRPVAVAPVAEPDDADADEVLELSDPMPGPAAPPRPAAPAPRAAAEPIVSAETAQVTRGALEALSRLLVKPEPSSDGTLEGLVRDMLRPLLREWIDANLPQMVEAMVAREIKRITGAQG